MGREGGKIFRDILPVTNIAQIQAVHTNVGFFTGHMEPILRHQAA